MDRERPPIDEVEVVGRDHRQRALAQKIEEAGRFRLRHGRGGAVLPAGANLVALERPAMTIETTEADPRRHRLAEVPTGAAARGGAVADPTAGRFGLRCCAMGAPPLHAVMVAANQVAGTPKLPATGARRRLAIDARPDGRLRDGPAPDRTGDLVEGDDRRVRDPTERLRVHDDGDVGLALRRALRDGRRE